MKTKTLTPKGHPCFECDGGILLSVCEPFTTHKGPFQVSASISNYIRVLIADPTAFEILKERKWAVDRTKIAS